MESAFFTCGELSMTSQHWIGPLDAFWPRYYIRQAAMVFVLDGEKCGCEARTQQEGTIHASQQDD